MSEEIDKRWGMLLKARIEKLEDNIDSFNMRIANNNKQIAELKKKLEGENQKKRPLEERGNDFSGDVPADSKPDQLIDISVCDSCKNLVPEPIGDCLKHEISGSKIGEYPKCFHLTKNEKHKDYFESADEKLKTKHIVELLEDGRQNIYLSKSFTIVAKDDLQRMINELFDFDKCDGVAEDMQEKYLKERYDRESER